MACKTILIHIPTPERVGLLLDAAIPLARKHGAHLIGLHVTPQPHVYVAAAAEMSAAVLVAQSEYYAEQADLIARAFEDRTKNEDLVCEWRQIDSNGYPVADVINAQTASADLVILGQTLLDGDWESRSDLPSRVIMEGGRPVLIVPRDGVTADIGNYITIAWDGGREAARATFDALPLLQHASQVKVLSLDQEALQGRTAFTPSDAITLNLVRHGISAEAAHYPSGGGGIGETLLSYAAEFGSDLMVMGCYGHTRFREFIFGGATRHVLQHSTIPVLMSH